MYKNNLFINDFLKNISDKHLSFDWRYRVLDYADKFEMETDKANFVAEEIYCRLINDLDILRFPLTTKEVKELEGIAAQLPLNIPIKVFERFHLAHYVIFKTLKKKEIQ